MQQVRYINVWRSQTMRYVYGHQHISDSEAKESMRVLRYMQPTRKPLYRIVIRPKTDADGYPIG